MQYVSLSAVGKSKADVRNLTFNELLTVRALLETFPETVGSLLAFEFLLRSLQGT